MKFYDRLDERPELKVGCEVIFNNPFSKDNGRKMVIKELVDHPCEGLCALCQWDDKEHWFTSRILVLA